jgi:N-methylhydantoinase A/acetophenone carboxylase
MPATIDIDIGGTFTDCYVVFNDSVIWNKVPTTGYDLAVGFRQALEEAAQSLELNVEELLRQTEVIRYSTTLGTNTLIQRSGAKLGLITSMGQEDTIYIGRLRQWADGLPLSEIKNRAKQKKPEPLIPRELTVGLRERIDCFGNVVIHLQRDEILEKVQYLVDHGVMGFVVSLMFSFLNPVHELMVKEVIEEEYPDFYLGSMPILLSSEVCPHLGEYARTMTTIISAYVHPEMVDGLCGLGDELRDQGYRKPLLVMHNTGGVAKLSRTAAVYTHNAGPVAGVIGSAHWCHAYGDSLLVTDMGGTSFDIATIVNAKPKVYDFLPLIDRWRIAIYAIETKSIGAGGSSIAWIDPNTGLVRVGPKSAGSMPGPAAYDLGGTDPTVTDADIVLGYLNPEYHLGGKVSLNKEKSLEALREKIGKPLGISEVEAAVSIKRLVDGNMGQEISSELMLNGYDPRQFATFAYGGAGATHCCGYDDYLNTSRTIAFPYSSVFSAFGSSTSDVIHTYSAGRKIVLHDHVHDRYLTDLEAFNEAVQAMQRQALADMVDEGFPSEQLLFALNLEMRYGAQVYTTLVPAPKMFLETEDDVKALCEAFTMEYSRLYSSAAAYPMGGIEVNNMILKATASTPHTQMQKQHRQEADPGHALKGHRQAYWIDTGGFTDTPVYELALLQCGNVVDGPAIIEGESTTVVLPPGRRFMIDEWMNGVIERY